MNDNYPYTQTNTPSFVYSPCIDINGKVIPHGHHYTPPGSPCSECLCHNGKSGNSDQPGICIMVSCAKPRCQKYKRIPGKCCDYKCEDEVDVTDKATLAIVISLSIVLVFTLVAITFVLRKIRRKEPPFAFAKSFGRRLSLVSLNSQTHLPMETNIDEMIQKHSIPNNLRQSANSKTPVLSSCSSYSQKPSNTKVVNIDNCEKGTSNSIHNYATECSSLSCNGTVDIESMDGSSNDTAIKLRNYELPSVRSPLLSTAFI